MLKNTASQKVIVFAFDSTTNLPKTGDAANITAYISKDFGAVTALTDTSATEMDATNAKGYYLFDITQTETNADTIHVTAKSSTANIVVVGAPAAIFTYPTGGIASPTNITAASGITVATNNDKTGYSLSQTFPTNFSALAITAGGAVTVGTNNDKTGYTVSTVSDKTGYSLTAVTGLGNQTANITGNLSGSVGSVSGAVGSVTAGVTVTTNNDKTGYTASTVSDKTGYSIATGGVGTGDIDATALNEIADAILDRVLSAGADSGADTTSARTVRQALRALRNRVAIAAGTMTVYKENDTTASWTSTMTRTAGDPISESNPT